MQNVYLVIDLKTFYASVECVERNLDPFSTNLVVADPARGTGAIFYEEYYNKNPRTQNYFKEFTIEIDTDKSFEVDLSNYIEIE